MGCPELFTISFRMMGSLLLWISIVLIALDGCTSATAFNGSEWLLEISTVHCPPSHHCGVSSNNVNEQRQSASCCVECSCESNKVAKIRNRYNQVPHLTQDTNGKVTNSQKTPQTRAKRSALSQQVTTKHI